VVVSVRRTVAESSAFTGPTPGSITQVSAFAEVQVRVTLSPDSTLVGSPLRATVGAGSTVTVVWAVEVPPRPVAVRV
jgi:hypothetical protein